MEISITEYITRLDEWQRKLDEQGTLPTKADLLEALEYLCQNQVGQEKQEELEGRLLYLLAIHRSKQNEQDDLYYLLLEEADRILGDRSDIKVLLQNKELNQYNGLFASFRIPTLRETDNRTAKRNTAIQIINETKLYMNRTSDALEQLSQTFETATSKTVKRYFEEIGNSMEATLSVAEEYVETLSGSFHTATVYQEFRASLNILQKNIDQFNEYISQNNQDDDTNQKSALDELNEMVGLIGIKKRVNQLY